MPCCSEGQSPDEPLWVPFVCLWVFCPIPDLMCIHSVLCRAKSLQSPLTLSDPMDCSLPAPLSMGFSRQEYWSGLPCPLPGDLPDPGIEPMSHVSCTGGQVLYHKGHLGSPHSTLLFLFPVVGYNSRHILHQVRVPDKAYDSYLHQETETSLPLNPVAS